MTTLLTDRLLQTLRPREKLTPSAWADRYRRLTKAEGASEQGPWRTSRVPYTREWMDSAACPWVREVTVLCSTQVGKTEATNNVLAWTICYDPAPIVMVMPRKDDARQLGEKRLKPMVQGTPALRSQLTGRKYDWTKREISFLQCNVFLRAAQVAADLASVPARLLIGDEAGKWPTWSGREASPWQLALERQRTWPNAIAYLTSTPVLPDDLITREFHQGDKRRYWVPCPHCGKHQVLKYGQVRWDDAIKSSREMRRVRRAHYECEHCHAAVEDSHKQAMVAAGVWVPEGRDLVEWLAGGQAADRCDHRSYHLWAAYSPWLPFWKIVAKDLASRDDPGDRQNFVNSWLAEPWQETVDQTTDENVAACISKSHELMGVPEKVLVLTAGVDVQKHDIRLSIWAWAVDEESWLVHYENVADWNGVSDALFRNRYGPKKLAIACAFVDSRYRRVEVMKYCRDNPLAKMIAGVERQSPLPFTTTKLERDPRTGAPLEKTMMVWHLNVGFFKDLLAHRVQMTVADGEGPHTLHLPHDVGRDFLQQFTAEHKVLVRGRGHKAAVERWVKKPGRFRNDHWDTSVYAHAAAQLIGVDRMREELERMRARAARRRAQGSSGDRDEDEGDLGLWRR